MNYKQKDCIPERPCIATQMEAPKKIVSDSNRITEISKTQMTAKFQVYIL